MDTMEKPPIPEAEKNGKLSKPEPPAGPDATSAASSGETAPGTFDVLKDSFAQYGIQMEKSADTLSRGNLIEVKGPDGTLIESIDQLEDALEKNNVDEATRDVLIADYLKASRFLRAEGKTYVEQQKAALEAAKGPSVKERVSAAWSGVKERAGADWAATKERATARNEAVGGAAERGREWFANQREQLSDAAQAKVDSFKTGISGFIGNLVGGGRLLAADARSRFEAGRAAVGNAAETVGRGMEKTVDVGITAAGLAAEAASAAGRGIKRGAEQAGQFAVEKGKAGLEFLGEKKAALVERAREVKAGVETKVAGWMTWLKETGERIQATTREKLGALKSRFEESVARGRAERFTRDFDRVTENVGAIDAKLRELEERKTKLRETADAIRLAPLTGKKAELPYIKAWNAAERQRTKLERRKQLLEQRWEEAGTRAEAAKAAYQEKFPGAAEGQAAAA